MPDVLERLRDAQNAHDLDAFVACFDPRYRSEQPVHPDRAFGGREQVGENWRGIFQDVPDFQATLIASAIADDTIWAEWDWHGNRRDSSVLHMRGVTLFGLRGGLIAWGRLYMELVEEDGAGIREAVRRMREGGL